MNNQQQLPFLYTAARLNDVLELLDEVHTAASDNTLDLLNATGKAEIVSWLREIAYIANETIAEIDAQQPSFRFRVIEGGASGDASLDVPGDGLELEDFQVLVAAGETSVPFQPLKRAGG